MIRSPYGRIGKGHVASDKLYTHHCTFDLTDEDSLESYVLLQGTRSFRVTVCGHLLRTTGGTQLKVETPYQDELNL